MKKKLIVICIFLTLIAGFGKISSASAQIINGGPVIGQPVPPPPQEYCQTCSQPVGTCYCNYATPGCYPSAPLCGTTCGVSYLSMALAIGLVIGVAAIILTASDHDH